MSNREIVANNSQINAEAEGFRLSYRQNRRLQQAKRAGGAKRGPSRGLKSRRWREKHPNEKPYAKISDTMLRVVGTKAAQFISVAVDGNWRNMDKTAKDRLYEKIQGEWNLPRLVGGLSLRSILSSQCAALYRGWRYRLKERYYIGYSIAEAKRNRPAGIDINKWEWLVDVFWSDPKQQRISDKNKRNKLKQTVLHSNGAKSTARILEELMNTPQGEVQQSQQSEGLDGTSLEVDSEQQRDPLYVRLYEKTHRHATTGLMEPDAEANLKALRELHEKQLQEHGVDNLTPQEAFPMVLKECSGYIRGLGAGPKPPKKARGASAEVRAEIEQLQQAAADKECALRAEIERVKQESLERENKLRQESIDRENKLKQESIEREKKMRAELMAELMSMMQSST
ncbi:Reticulocyte-binding protein 2-like protein a [Bienertia sinuspersici]